MRFNRKRWAYSTAVLLAVQVSSGRHTASVQVRASTLASQPAPAQTLCILDFLRLGEDASMDWLRPGLADMMISTMNRLSPYRVIERRYLRDILREHGLAESGLVETVAGVRQARLAKAQLLLLGSFALRQDRLAIQVRLLRISDQQILAQATWADRPVDVLAAPQVLSRKLLANLGKSVEPGQLPGIEREIPTTVEVARAYYNGVGAFDEGRYPEALALYLDAARQGGPSSRLIRP